MFNINISIKLVLFTAIMVLNTAESFAESGCMNAGKWTTRFFRAGKFANIKLEISIGNDALTTKAFIDSDWALVGVFGVTREETYKVVSHQETLLPSGKCEVNVTVELIDSLETQMTRLQVEDYNKNKYCGYSDWQVGAAKTVTGLTCRVDKDDNDPTVNPPRGTRSAFKMVFYESRLTVLEPADLVCVFAENPFIANKKNDCDASKIFFRPVANAW